MEEYLDSLRMMKRWHVPCCIVTLAAGIYFALVCLVPSFGQEYHEMLHGSNYYPFLPYALFILIGLPLYSLWFYKKLDSDKEFREQCYEIEND